MNVALALAVAALSSAAMPDPASVVDLGRANEIIVGHGRGVVVATLGDPLDRQLNGKREVLQYCARDGITHNKFLIVWLTDGYVDGMSTYSRIYGGKCDKQFRPINWNEAPGVVKTAG